MATAKAIFWPDKFRPGTTDNYVSNEVIVQGISATDVWEYLVDISKWETYYDNCSQIQPPTSGSRLSKGDKFSFSTFGFPPLECSVAEAVSPSHDGQEGRLAWRAWLDGDADTAVDVYHAWLVEDLPANRVRILTQESQIGKPAAELAKQRPNKMLNGHQDWLDGLVKSAKAHRTR